MIILAFFIAFIIFSAVHIIGEIIYEQKEPNPIRYYTKPFLMPLLAIYYIVSIDSDLLNGWIITGIIFGCIGDIALMFAKKNKKAFLLGIGAFLFGHIWYIVAFLGSIVNPVWIAWYVYVIAVPLAVFGLYIFRVLRESLGKMKIPVIAYIIIIMVMLWAAIALSSTLSSMVLPAIEGLYLVLGACLFVTSDTLNAWEKFKRPLPYNRAIIMVTYLLAQWFIIEAFIGSSGIL